MTAINKLNLKISLLLIGPKISHPTKDVRKYRKFFVQKHVTKFACFAAEHLQFNSIHAAFVVETVPLFTVPAYVGVFRIRQFALSCIASTNVHDCCWKRLTRKSGEVKWIQNYVCLFLLWWRGQWDKRQVRNRNLVFVCLNHFLFQIMKLVSNKAFVFVNVYCQISAACSRATYVPKEMKLERISFNCFLIR